MKKYIKRIWNFHFIVDLKDIEKVLRSFQKYDLADPLFPTGLRIGNCGWAKAPTAYYVTLSIPRNEIEDLIADMRNQNVNFLSETTTGF